MKRKADPKDKCRKCGWLGPCDCRKGKAGS